MKNLVAQVVIDGAIGSFDKEYSYAVPPHLKKSAKVGCRVTMPFGRGNLKRQGLIVGFTEAEKDGLKELYDVTDSEPILSEEMLILCKALRERTFCTYFDAVKAMLPAGLNYRLTSYFTVNEEFLTPSLLSDEEKDIYNYIKENPQISEDKIKHSFLNATDFLIALEDKQAIVKDSLPLRKTGDLTRRWLKIHSSLDTENLPKLTQRQQEIFDLVSDFGEVSVKELQYFTGVTVSVINNLVSKCVLESFEKQEFRTPYRMNKNPQRTEIILTDEQKKAYNGIKAELDSGKPSASLLYGVTGSGKTQVFLKLTDYVSDMGKGVIIMVPEIALTPQIINIFSNRYGSRIAVFHSAMSQGQRMDEYKRVKEGRATIAIGTRSAVFAPFSNLGLIIIDEEQEHTYKSEKSPRFHARDVAKLRAGYHNCSLCLASATPSVESYSLALNGKYKLFTLTKRYGNAILPEVTAVDMRQELLNGNSGSISNELATAIGKTLDEKNQAIVLLNRRGHNTYISCPSCGWVASCPNCSISMTYHSANGRMMCHYCGFSEPKPAKCPQCENQQVRFMGVGTQKVEEELQLLFPEANILR
ncbi:MAG: primosomal protein N', partial [Clostridia bacterium]|nr:primosomal protein N' [Clostridia bacterium]